MACGFYSVWLGTDIHWDLKNYHLYNPYGADRYHIDVAPAQLQTYFNDVLDWPLYLAVRFFNSWPRCIAFFQGMFHGLNIVCVAALSWRLLGAVAASRSARFWLSAIAVLIGATGAGSTPLIGAATGDLIVAIPVLFALYIAICAVSEEKEMTQRATLAGAAAGLAFGLKATAGVFCPALAIALACSVPRRLCLQALLKCTLGGVAGFVISGGYHAARMTVLFRNPYFPLFNDIFKSPYAEAVAFRDTLFIPASIFAAFKLPFYWALVSTAGMSSEHPFRDARFAVIAILALAALTNYIARLYRRTPSNMSIAPALKLLLVFFSLSYALWLGFFGIYRYVMPLELISGVLIVRALGSLHRGHLLPVLSAVLAMALVVSTQPLEWGHKPWGERYFDVRMPSITSKTLVLMAGGEPMSYLAPFAPVDTRWVRMYNGLVNPSQDTVLLRQARRAIQIHKGDIQFLAPGVPADSVKIILSQEGLSRTAAPCSQILSNFEQAPLQACPVKLSTKKSAF